ncbi:MAG TPA: hypothetical protein VII12_06960, partial [Thermoanaerobaculia bacterium]
MIEPLTAATDVVVAAAGATFAVRIVRATADRAARLVAASLAAASFGALAGAAYHMAPSSALWKVSAIPVGIASYLFGLAIALAYFSARVRRVAQAVLLVQLSVYAICVALSDDFAIVIADYASVMAAILLVCLFHWSDPAAKWIAAGVAISFVAAAAQISSIQIGPLNHNDIYHVIELGGLYCWYRGGR